MTTPTGWRLVPEEPTETMVATAVVELYVASGGDLEATASELRRALVAAFAAAPQPPASPEPTLWALTAREALELIAAPMRPDGTWNRDREACRQIAAEALGRYDELAQVAQPEPSGLTDKEIDAVIERHAGSTEVSDDEYRSAVDFARAIERLVREKK